MRPCVRPTREPSLWHAVAVAGRHQSAHSPAKPRRGRDSDRGCCAAVVRLCCGYSAPGHVADHEMPSPSEYRWCRAAYACGEVFTISCFCERVWGSSSGSTRTGAGPVLARMRHAGLAEKLGRNRFGELLHQLTAEGIAAANADPLEVAESRAVVQATVDTTPAPRTLDASWTDVHGVRWSVHDGWACWIDPHGVWIRAYQVHVAR